MRIVVAYLQWCIKRGFYIYCVLGLVSMTWLFYKNVTSPSAAGRQHPRSTRQYIHFDVETESSKLSFTNKDIIPTLAIIKEPQDIKKFVVQNKALLILDDKKQGTSILIAISQSRWKSKTVYFKQITDLILTQDDHTGLYSVIVFEDLRIYLSLSKETRGHVDSYCRRFHVGVIYFMHPQKVQTLSEIQLLDFPLSVSTYENIATYTVSHSSVADIVRTNVSHDVKAVSSWIVFHSNDSTYETISYGETGDKSSDKLQLAILDTGKHDGVSRIFFGQAHQLWIHKILFLDALSYLTAHKMKMDKNKYIQIDIDDMFLGKNGTKMKSSDAKALKEAQEMWREKYVSGFSFYIGFSGRSYKKGLPQEQEGDMEMIKLSPHFKWFDHTFSHIQVHKFDDPTEVIHQMQLSKQFAEEHGIQIAKAYAVAPHHSGVYPTDDILYDAWKTVWNITVTSTEEYPHLKPFHLHRGFIYKGIKVLPREVCGLYTTNLYYKSYPRGPAALEYNILGGPLFESVLYNYVNIYMTHQQNYGADRLAIYTFTKLFKLFHEATTLDMKGVPPEHLAELYFNRYPQEVDPVWLNPCVDKRHREIWNPGKKCSDFPSLLVVGPQKTGSTALYTFLKLHPNVSANLDSPTSYEELQFFGSPNYNKGIDWYRSFFPSGRAVKFEKSATYFDKEAVPMQAGALLPSAKVIIILLDPITRAFSWYHHQRAHNDHAALSHSFYDVITNTDKHNREVQSLKTHLLRPGFYYEHIQRWRRYYPDSQIMYVDGEQLTSDPAQVMTDVQLFLNTDVLIDYRHILSFEDEKGFYCIKRSVGRPKCLGAGKGRVRQYGQVDEKSRAYLQQVFYTPNLALKHLLAQVGSPIPSWLAANS